MGATILQDTGLPSSPRPIAASRPSTAPAQARTNVLGIHPMPERKKPSQEGQVPEVLRPGAVDLHCRGWDTCCSGPGASGRPGTLAVQGQGRCTMHTLASRAAHGSTFKFSTIAALAFMAGLAAPPAQSIVPATTINLPGCSGTPGSPSSTDALALYNAVDQANVNGNTGLQITINLAPNCVYDYTGPAEFGESDHSPFW